MNTLKFKLEGLTCEACVKIATKRLKAIAGIDEVVIELATGNTEVISRHPLTIDEIAAGLADTHYTVVK